jgi:hypothetical protein
LRHGFADRESDEFKNFLDHKKEHPRYRYLPDRDVDQAFLRVKNNDIPEEIKTHKFSSTGEGPFTRPNFYLQKSLYRLVAKNLITKSLTGTKNRTIPYKLTWIWNCYPTTSIKTPGTQARKYAKLEKDKPLENMTQILTTEEANQVVSVSGEWGPFLRNYISEYLTMQADKIARLEKSFGPKAFKISQLSEKIKRPYQDYPYYKQIRGRQLTRHEMIAAYDEADEFYLEALAAYISKGLGYNLTDFATDFRRVPSFRERGLDEIRVLLTEQSRLTEYPLGGTNEEITQNSKKLCKELSRKSL